MIAWLLGCSPFASWPPEDEVFPYVYTPETGLPAYADVRVETETWTPLVDLEETANYALKAAHQRPGAPPEELLHFGEMRAQIPRLVKGDPTITFTGDLMMIDGDPQGVAEAVADRLDGLRVTNLETPVAPSFPTILDRSALIAQFGLYAFNTSPTILDDLPFDVVQLTNNHANDLGPEGIQETLAQIAAHGLDGIGLDGNGTVVDVGGQRIALRAYTWGLNRYDPPPGVDVAVIPFGHLGERIDLSRVRREARADRAAGADQVVVLVHWGYEYEYYPDPHFLILGRRLVEAGADLVVGTGPHVVQPAEICRVNQPSVAPGIGACAVRTDDGVPRNAAVLYSLGDFATDLQTSPLQVGILASVSFDPAGGVSGMRWDPVVSDHTGSVTRTRPLLAAPDEDGAFAAESLRLDAHLGTSWRREAWRR